jgi:hypothetical protein
MQISEPARQTLINFAEGTVTRIDTRAHTDPEFRIDRLGPTEFQQARSRGSDGLLQVTSDSVPAVNAIGQEHDDFIASIVERRLPRVTGERAREALRVAEQIVHRIRDASSSRAFRYAA